MVSNGSTTAWSVSVPLAGATPVIVMSASAPASIRPPVQVTVWTETPHWNRLVAFVTDIEVRPAGRVSTTLTLLALPVP